MVQSFLSSLAFECASASCEDAVRALVARIPGAHLCVAGASKRIAGDAPARPFGALLAYDAIDVARALAARSPSLFESTGIDGASAEVETIDATVQIPLTRAPGQRFYALVATFDYAPGPGDAAAAERHYLEYHVPRSRELLGLRGYVMGRVLPDGCTLPPRARMGVEIWDDRDAMDAAFRTPNGRDLYEDGKYVCADVRLHYLDGVTLL